MKNIQLLLFIPLIMSVTGCSNQVTLNGQDQQLASRNVTEAEDVVVFPDDNPSIADGKVTFEKMKCAECHSGGGGGHGAVETTSAQTTANEQKAEAAMHTKPTAAPGERQVNTAGFSSNLSDKTAAWKVKPLDQYLFLTYGDPNSPKHPVLKNQLSRREIWDLVFYSRSLAEPFPTEAKWMELDPVFGANCAVCHGKRGHGDGPLARNMEPVPANFHQFPRFYDRTDQEIWEHIAYGIKWEGMPNFLGKTDKAKNVKFDDAYIRQLTQYVRTFHSSNLPTLAQSPAGASPVGGQANPTPAQEESAPSGFNKEGQVNTGNDNSSNAGSKASPGEAPATTTGGAAGGSKAGE